MQLPGGPVAEQAVEQSDDAVIMQLDAGHAARANSHQRRQLGKGSAIDGGVEQFRLLFEVTVGGGSQAPPSATPISTARWNRSCSRARR